MNQDIKKDAFAVAVGGRIRKCRLKRKLTQMDVSRATGISQKHLSRIEQGYHDPHFDLIIKIAAALDVPVDMLAKDWDEDYETSFLNYLRPLLEALNKDQLEQLFKLIDRLLAAKK